MTVEERLWGQTQQFGFSLVFSITSHIHPHPAGPRQIYKITLPVCFNMSAEGSEVKRNSSLNTSPFTAFNHHVFQVRKPEC